MKKILLLSDTHNYIDETILKYATQADEVWHAGDIGTISVAKQLQAVAPLRAVFGNIDGQDIRREFRENQFFNCEEVSVFMTHIGGYPSRYAFGILPKLQELRPKIFICGHSHILKIIFDKKLNILHLNPGAVGKYGFHKVRTMLRFEIDKTEIKNMEIIELGKN